MENDRDANASPEQLLAGFVGLLKRRTDARVRGGCISVYELLTPVHCADLMRQIHEAAGHSRKVCQEIVIDLCTQINFVLGQPISPYDKAQDIEQIFDQWMTVNSFNHPHPRRAPKRQAKIVGRINAGWAASPATDDLAPFPVTPDSVIETQGPHKVYRFYGRGDILLYVGKTDSIERRVWQHMTSKPWWPQMVRMQVEGFDSSWEAARRETYLIEHCAPLFNIQGNKGRELA